MAPNRSIVTYNITHLFLYSIPLIFGCMHSQALQPSCYVLSQVYFIRAESQ